MGDVNNYTGGPSHGETGGMLGDCGALTMADTWLRGVRDFDVERAYEVARRSAFTAATSRRDSLDPYMTLRYVPVEAGGSSASKTMEYAYADGAVANWARGIGRADDARALTERSAAYRNLWDPAQGFLVGRSRDGAFSQLRSHTGWQDFYAEGGAWQYLWYAPHDLADRGTLLGGSTTFSRGSRCFTTSRWRRGTPLPDLLLARQRARHPHARGSSAGDFAGARASRYIDWVRSTRYARRAETASGRHDAGTVSAWCLFSALEIVSHHGLSTNCWPPSR
nr:glycoside hydrolase family 92 protein [Deltaproteobacteria bacterium]